MDSLYCHLFTSTSYFWNNVRLLGIFGGRLLAPALCPWSLILAGLFFIMLFRLLKQIINVMKSSRLHCPVDFMLSITITSKITSLLNLSRIREPNVYSYVTNFIVASDIPHLFYKKYVKYLTALIKAWSSKGVRRLICLICLICLILHCANS